MFFQPMFESTDFSINYNNLINIYIDLNKSYQKFFDASVPFMKTVVEQRRKRFIVQRVI